MDISYNNYLSTLVLTTLTLLLSVSFISYKVDPEGIYHDSGKEEANSSISYVAKLLTTTHGLLKPGNSWNERDLKSSLARNNNSNADCAVIGSSHVMQISSFRRNASLVNICPSIINLGVSGGTLEDYLALSYMLVNNKKPKTIVFGIDPWALDFRRDSRWERYSKEYYLMKALLENKSSIQEDGSNQKIKYITNLINPQYFYRSVQLFGKKMPEIVEAPSFNLLAGIENPVYLPDGSLVYSREYISNANSSEVPIGGSNYKIKTYGSQYSFNAVLLFKKLVHFLKKADINTVIVMTPYHHNVWKDKNSITTKALIDMEVKIRSVGKELQLEVLGSYDPDKIGCVSNEFYDMMHAKYLCLEKIEKL